MTRDDIVSFACNKLGVTDATSTSRCNDFVQRRFQMIYDMESWRDTLKLVTGLSVDTTGVLNLPSNIDRVLGIRSTGDHALDPVDSVFLMKYDPTIFERTGDPLAFEEFSDSSSSFAKKIRVWPIPTSTTALILVGKMSCPTLGASDSPSTFIRNIDNCLVAYSQGDMLQRMRQYGKAQQLYQEAASLLEVMRGVENQQAARQWIIIPDAEAIDSLGPVTGDWFFSKA